MTLPSSFLTQCHLKSTLSLPSLLKLKTIISNTNQLKLRKEHKMKHYWYQVPIPFYRRDVIPYWVFSSVFLTFFKMVCKTILTSCLSSATPPYNGVWASGVNSVFLLAVANVSLVNHFFPNLCLIVHIIIHAWNILSFNHISTHIL